MTEGDRANRVDRERDAPLAWALRKPVGPLTHIRYLTPSENGANCNCTCPGCGAELVAVNADKDDEYLRRPRVRRPYFRHAVGQQRGRCLDRAARAAAMHLFMTEDVVWLPPRTWNTTLDIGHPGLVRPPERVLVAERRWLDSLSGILVLADGRKIVVTLDAMSMVDVEGYEFVLEVKCTDPAIATMPPEDILRQLQTDASSVSCWIRHADDTKQGQVLQDLEDQFLGGMPPDLVEGMSKLHSNETVLHWLIKEALKSCKSLYVPEFGFYLNASERNSTKPVHVEIPRMNLEIIDAQLEKRVGNVVPDVFCKARRLGSDDDPFDLLIEATVTHGINENKRQKILSLGLAALEVKSSLFPEVGRVPAIRIQQAVIHESRNKEWILHPFAKQYEAEMRLRIAQQEVRDAEARQWCMSADNTTLTKLAHVQAMGNLSPWSSAGLRAPSQVSEDMIRTELRKRRIEINPRSWICGPGGLVASIETVRNGSMAALKELLGSCIGGARWFQANPAPYLLFATQCWEPGLDRSGKALLADVEQHVIERLKVGDARILRTDDADRILTSLYPELADYMRSDFATVQYLNMVRQEALQAHATAEHERTMQAFAEHEKHVRAEIAKELPRITAGFDWHSAKASAREVSQALALKGRVGFYEDDTLNIEDVIKHGWNCRRDGLSVEQALSGLEIKAIPDAEFVLHVWVSVYLVRKLWV